MNLPSKLVDKIITFFIVSALVLVPTYFTTMIQNSFTIEKHVIFRFCTLVLLAVSVAKYVYDPRKIKLPKIFWLVPVFWGVALLSTIFAAAPMVSLWGIHLRMDGLATMTFFVVFFVLLYLHIDSPKKMRQIIWAIVLGSIIPVAYALCQKIGFDPLSWKDVVAADRVFGTTGNPAYLGAYLLFVMPMTFYLVTTLKSKWRWFFSGLILLQVLSLLFTWTRAAYLGFFLSFFILLFGYFQIKGSQLYSRIILGIYSAAILFIVLLNFSPSFAQIFAENRYINRLSSISQVDEGTAKDRLEMWKIAGQAIAKNPVLGTGQTSYYMHFNQNYPNYMDSRPEKDRYSNYPHNIVLDYGVSFGITGIIIFLSIILAYLYTGYIQIKQHQKTKRKILLLCLISALAGYFVQALFNIDTIITWTYFYGFLALILAASFRIDEEIEYVDKKVSVLKQIIVTLSVILSLAAIYFLAINPARADKNYLHVNYNNNLTSDQKLALAKQSNDYTPYYEYSHMKLSDVYLSKINYQEPSQLSTWYQASIDEVDLALNISPHNYKNHLSKGLIYGNWAKIDSSKLTLAEEALTKAKELAPSRLGLHHSWGNMYLDLGMIKKAQEQYKIAEGLNPEVGETYYHQAKTAFLDNNIDQGDLYLQKATDLGYAYDQTEFFQRLASTAFNIGHKKVAAYLANKANSSSIEENTALLEIQSYLDLSQPAQAKEKALQYIKLLPELEEKLISVVQ